MDLWEYLIKYGDRIGVICLMLVAFVGGFKGWWIFGHQYAAKCRECEEWKSLALSTHQVNKRLERTTERAIGTTEQALQRAGDATPNTES